MTQVELKLTLSDPLAREAKAAGLLTPESVERLIREEVRRRRVDQFFSEADRLTALDLAPLTEAEVEAEIRAVRAERREARAGGR
jgi:post-segregation antitoxin (ccd killing protein)